MRLNQLPAAGPEPIKSPLSSLTQTHQQTPRIIPSYSLRLPRIIRQETLKADAEAYAVDKILDQVKPAIPIIPTTKAKSNLSRLVDEDFPFDDSQLIAINGLAQEKHGCLTGAAGTGKTTVTKAFTDRIIHDLPSLDMTNYFKKSSEGDSIIASNSSDDPEDTYEQPESLIPAIALCAFTGRASQMIKKNFPRDWHGNIMTIHRLLGYYPEFYEDFDESLGQVVKKKRFVPLYNKVNKLPFKIIVIDEAGMLGLDLWLELIHACKPDTRIYFIGDINQLPPTHGKSIFGFAMSKWPTWELTHIHRQKGANNSIVDNAWKIVNGQYPVSDDPHDPDWKFYMDELPADSDRAAKMVRAWLSFNKKAGTYSPNRDAVITPINAFEETSGYALGQDPLNRDLALMFNENPDRYLIDAGRDKRRFAVGDKVMATKNDHEAGITNGMTGIITAITVNGDYGGNAARFGLAEQVNQYLQDGVEQDDEGDFSLDDLSTYLSSDSNKVKEKEKKDRGPASHSVLVQFGTEENPHVQTFRTFAEISTLMTAYAMTCHKLQGGEVPVVVIILHHSHKRMLTREWFYTAVTRASQKCVVLYTRMGLSAAVNKQTIKGKNTKEKIESFARLMDPNGLFGNILKVELPEAQRITHDQ